MLSLGGDSSEEDEDMCTYHIDNQQMVTESSTDQNVSSIEKKNEDFGGSKDIKPMRSILFKKEDEEEEDEDDVPLPYQVTAVETEVEDAPEAKVASQEYIDALHAISLDPWDTASWVTYLEEAEHSRAGSVPLEDVYQKFTAQFPRAFNFWKSFAEYLVKKNDLAAAELVFKKCLPKCRSVDLWLSYLAMTKKRTIDKVSKAQEQQYTIERQAYDNAFKSAVENVGMSIESSGLWRAYIDFVRDWPETNSMDPGRKLLALRTIYQKAICIPMDDLDTIWKEYEQLEKKAGEHYAERVLPEHNEKYLHAKAIYKDRKKLTNKIMFDRLAVPPKQSLEELRQLDAWNKWIRFELTNPDNLSPEAFLAMMAMVFDQCLCCFRHHPEVWMAAARFDQDQHPRRISEARIVLREAIEVIPDVSLLRVALAELEESFGGVSGIEAAREVLRIGYESTPSAQTFAIYQRFVRRRDGIVAARRLFSETLPLRRDHRLDYQVYLVQAQMELDVNCSPETALKVLDLARDTDPVGTKDLRYARLLTRVLLRMGDLNQIRWVYQTLLEEDAWSLAVQSQGTAGEQDGEVDPSVGGNVITSGLVETSQNARGISSSSASTAGGSGGVGGAGKGRPLREQLQLWEDYLHAETILGLSDVARLDQLRGQRNRVRSLLEADRARALGIAPSGSGGNRFGGATSAVAAAAAERLGAHPGLFERPAELCERYDVFAASSLRIALNPDESLRQRCRGKALIDEVSRSEEARLAALKEAGASRRRGEQGGLDMTDSQLSTLPPIIREFLGRLPPHNGPAPDVDGMIRQLRSMVLPPRPTIDESEAAAAAAGKRSRADDTGAILGLDDGENADDDEIFTDSFTGRDDVFRRRQRERLFH